MGDHGESLGEHGEARPRVLRLRSDAARPLPARRPLRRRRRTGGRRGGGPGRRGADAARAGRGRGRARAGSGAEPGAAARRRGRAGGCAAARLQRGLPAAPPLRLGGAALDADRALALHRGAARRALRPRGRSGETRNLADSDRRSTRELRAALAALDATVRPAAAGSAPLEEDEETMRALAALGYIGGQAIDIASRSATCPTRRTASTSSPGWAGRAVWRAARTRRSRSRCSRRCSPRTRRWSTPGSRSATSTCACATSRRAAEDYRETLARRPDHDWAMIGLADTYVARGEVDEAVAGYRRYLQSDPGNAQIQYRLARSCSTPAATRSRAGLHRTLEVEPKTARAEVGLAVVAFRAQGSAGGARGARPRAGDRRQRQVGPLQPGAAARGRRDGGGGGRRLRAGDR